MLGPVLGERERKTLAFVMSLPATPRDYAIAKMLASFLMFLIPATIAATALVALSPRAGWGAYALVLFAGLFFFSIVLAAAIVSESIGWTIGVLTGLMFVVGNLVLQLAPSIGWIGRYLEELARGGPALPATIGIEAAGIALVVATMLRLQERKTSFV